MSSHARARRFSQQGRNKYRSKKSQEIIILPKIIRDELRMCVALRGYSAIREGEGKTLQQQYVCMEDFYHGKPGHSPSQIMMMAEGELNYADLYKSTIKTITSKKSQSKTKKNTAIKYYLKESLSRDDSRRYYQGTDITVRDLEKKLRTGKAILHGRQLTTMAKKGIREYRKALSFTKDKWDLKTNQPKESGTSVDDVIEYVRQKMYKKSIVVIDSDGDGDDDDDDVVTASKLDKISIKAKCINQSSSNKKIDKDDVDDGDDDDDDHDVDDDGDDDNDDNDDNGNNADDDDDGDDDNDDDKDSNKKKGSKNKDKDEDDDNDDSSDDDGNDKDSNIVEKEKKRKNKTKGHNDDDDDSYKEEHNSKSSDSDESTSSDSMDDNTDIVPRNYIFPSFMAYVLWGPFASKEKKLPLFLLGKLFIVIFVMILLQ